MMKKPDEIKKGLECCLFGQCGSCPYSEEYGCYCSEYLRDDIREYHNQLEAERDAAVEDMKQAAIYLCCACKKYHPAVRGVSHHYCEVIGERDDFTGAISCGMFEWRGVQKEE